MSLLCSGVRLTPGPMEPVRSNRTHRQNVGNSIEGGNVPRARILTMDTFCPDGPTRVNIYPAPNVWVSDPRWRHGTAPKKCGQSPGSNGGVKNIRQSADTWTDDCLTERVNPRVTGVPMSPSTSLINDLSSEYTGERPRSMAHVVGEAASVVGCREIFA